MTTNKTRSAPLSGPRERLLAHSVFGPQNRDLQKRVEKLRRRYAKYELPISEVRKILDEELGDVSLSEELIALRGP